MSQQPQARDTLVSLTLAQVAEIVGGVVHGDPDTRIDSVVTDTREPMAPGALFVALRGPNFDGDDFAASALEQGAAAVLTTRPVVESSVVVPDGLAALQALAAANRAAFEGPVVAITGSNGKTIVKEMLAAICARRWTVHRSPRSYNSQVGVALTLLDLDADHDVAIVEAGISEIGEMERLQRMIRPTLGVLTNVGLAHKAGLKDVETTAREKMKLFSELEGPLVLPARLKLEIPAGVEALRFTVWSPERPRREPAQSVVWASGATDDAGVPIVAALPNGESREMRLNVPGQHNLENASAAIAAADALGLSIDEIAEGLATFSLSPMRLEMHTTPDGITLINDAYSSDPVSARAALNLLTQYGGGARRIAILGDMLDLGQKADELHRGLGQSFASPRRAQELVCVGELAAEIGHGAVGAGMPEEHVHFAASIDEAESIVRELVEPGDVVLFKGSRAVGLERVAERLLESVSPTKLHIDLDAIRDNFHAIRRRIGAGRGVIAVVKSFAYGNDSTRVSQLLVQAGVDALAVAYPDEAIPLRRRGITLPIFVTNALAREADKIVKHRLTPFLFSRPVAEALSNWALRFDEDVDVHLEIDSGMNRVGLDPDEALAFAEWVRGLPRVHVRGVMTHFSSADDPDEDGFTEQQFNRFSATVARLRKAGFELSTHVSNTAAAWRFPDLDADMVRVGLGLYGMHPSAAVGSVAAQTRPALRLSTEIIHLKTVGAGETVSYNRRWTAPGPRQIATIAAGYNDGFPRFMSNGGHVLIAGKRCPVVGSVCMDVSMVDVTELSAVAVGDEVVLFGEQLGATLSVDEIAARGDTINYEILCKISPRVRRIFVGS